MASESVDVPEVQELQNEIRIMKHDFEDQIKEIKENLLKVVQGKVDGHEKWIRRIESDADTKESKFHEEMKLKEKQLQELKAELAETKEETKKHLMETEKMQTELAEIKKEMKKQETEKEKQIKELRTNLTECEEKMKEMRTEHEEKHKSLLEELQVKDTRIFILEEKINEVEEHGKGNEKEIGKLASEMNMKAEKLIELESRMNEQKEKYIQLYYQIGEKGEKISQVEEMLWKKSGEISEVMHIDRETSERQFGEIMFKLNEGKKLTQSVLTENRCPFVWEVTNFKKEFAESKAENKAIITPVFYCLNGYKGRLQIYLNGTRECKDSFISVFFDLVEGPFDDTLAWPLPYEKFIITLTINNKQVTSKAIESTFYGGIAGEAYIRPTKKVTPGIGPRNFLSHKDLPNNIKNDTLTFKFDIQ